MKSESRPLPVLLPGAVLFTVFVCLPAKVGYLPLLLPLWAFTAYGIARAGKVLSLRELFMLQLLLGALICGMVLGEFQEIGLLNRLAHGGVALVVAAIVAAELSRFGPAWLCALAAFSLTVTLGASMEVAEALAGLGDALLANRFYDTIYDTTANLVGSAIGAGAWLWKSTQDRPGGES